MPNQATTYVLVELTSDSCAGAPGAYNVRHILNEVYRGSVKVRTSDIPNLAKGTALVLMIAGTLALAVMGFAGMGG